MKEDNLLSRSLDQLLQLLRLHLQPLLTEDQHQEVDEVGGQDLQEEDDKRVDEAVCADGAVGIPETAFKGVFVGDSLATLEDLSPGDRDHFCGRHVERRDLVLQVGSGTDKAVEKLSLIHQVNM